MDAAVVETNSSITEVLCYRLPVLTSYSLAIEGTEKTKVFQGIACYMPHFEIDFDNNTRTTQQNLLKVAIYAIIFLF